VIAIAALLWNARQPGARNIDGLARVMPPALSTSPPVREADAGSGLDEAAPAPSEVAETSRGSDVAQVGVAGARGEGEDRDARDRWSDEGLSRLLGEDGVPLTPPTAGRQYVIDRPSDLPGLVPGGADGEAASTPF
jgi:hypothetical protein